MGTVAMASFTPRVHPRPEYPPFSETMYKTFKSFAKDMLLGTVICMALYDPVQRIHAKTGASDRMAFTLLTNGVHTFAYLVIGGSLSLFDFFGWFTEFKLCRKPYMLPSRELVLKTIKEACVSQFLVSPLFSYYIGY